MNEPDVVSDTGYFAMVPEWVLFADISDRAIRLYAVLRRYSDVDGTAHPSRATLAAKVNASPDSVDRALSELESIGAVKRRQRWISLDRESVSFVKDGRHPSPTSNLIVVRSVRPGPIRTTADTRTGADDATAPVPNPMGTVAESPMGTGAEQTIAITNQRKEPPGSASGPPPPIPARLDVEQLCQRLRDRMIGNGNKPPTVTKAWRDAARLMLDADDRELHAALSLIDWCQSSEFWRTNILSMPKFREKYDQLRMQSLERQRRRPVQYDNGGRHMLVE